MSSLRTLKITLHEDVPSHAHSSLDPLVIRLTEDAGFLPVLNSLIITLVEEQPSDHAPFNTRTLSDLLCGRWESGLQHFELRSRRLLPELDAQARALREMGLRIHVETSPNLKVSFSRAEF
ncbi:hypothetical protein B0H16DRAFT_1455673 [Mycena metata]|uniref:Uncharacterized protein n=1 Tax=Mycena metata TaxID=1033252 RepID=A0AAD7NIZ2_9AGAR|nr:hypothetical protein B0H16DRAFT_1455673 [Mycena metata]